MLNQTFQTRSRLGRIWLFDPSGSLKTTNNVPEGVLELRWSPIQAASTWDNARQVADVMLSTATLGKDIDAGSNGQAKGFLASLLHAAALTADGDMDLVRVWVTNDDLTGPLAILSSVHKLDNERSVGAQLAFRVLSGIARNRDSQIVALAGAATDIYDSELGRVHAQKPNFDVDRFVASTDTIYVITTGDEDSSFAPVIAGLVNDIRNAARRATAQTPAGNKTRSVLIILDDAADTARLPNLPSLMGNAANHGLQVMACFQDFAQIRNIWGPDHGILSKCRTKMIFPGITDKEDLETLSTIIGDWDRPYRTETGNNSTTYGPAGTSTTTGTSEQYSTQRERLLSPSEISQIPNGHAILVRHTKWSLVEMLPHHTTNAWQKIATEHAVIVPTGQPDLLEPPSMEGLAPIDQLVAEFQKAPWQNHPK